MTEKKTDPALIALIGQLASPNLGTARKALTLVGKQAGIKELKLIIETLAKISDLHLKEEVTDLLSTIRAKEAPGIFAEAVANPDLAGIRLELTRACWESQLDFSNHLILFTHLFIAGDYGLALEAFSVIENTFLEHPVPQEITTEVFDLLKNSLPDQTETKARLVRELILVIEPFALKG
jgi:hypothetical protein